MSEHHTFLARHGETDDNLEPIRVQGFTDTPLNDIGRRQAAELAARVEPLGISSLWSSDLSARARDRRDRGRANRSAGGARQPSARGQPRRAGKAAGSSISSASEPERYAAWRRAGEQFRFPGGESLGEQRDRVLAALADIRGSSDPPSLVVCHGGSIRVALCARDPRGLAAFHSFKVPNVALVPL